MGTSMAHLIHVPEGIAGSSIAHRLYQPDEVLADMICPNPKKARERAVHLDEDEMRRLRGAVNRAYVVGGLSCVPSVSCSSFLRRAISCAIFLFIWWSFEMAIEKWIRISRMKRIPTRKRNDGG